MTHAKLTNQELLILFKQAAQDLRLNIDKNEKWFDELEAEVLRRMDSNLNGDQLVSADRGF